MKPFDVDRPWGSFRQFTNNEPSTVKLLHIKSGQEFSLQHHEHRSEFWRVIEGTPDITIGDVMTHSKPGDEFTIHAGVSHRVHAVGGDATCLEIATETFDENDIVREQDDYGRA
jgi:mannose-6-phosphate isomerase-like protein (cupin superfamily)